MPRKPAGPIPSVLCSVSGGLERVTLHSPELSWDLSVEGLPQQRPEPGGSLRMQQTGALASSIVRGAWHPPGRVPAMGPKVEKWQGLGVKVPAHHVPSHRGTHPRASRVLAGPNALGCWSAGWATPSTEVGAHPAGPSEHRARPGPHQGLVLGNLLPLLQSQISGSCRGLR